MAKANALVITYLLRDEKPYSNQILDLAISNQKRHVETFLHLFGVKKVMIIYIWIKFANSDHCATVQHQQTAAPSTEAAWISSKSLTSFNRE